MINNRKLNQSTHHSERKDWWIETSDEERKAIDEGLNDVKAGRTIPHEDVRLLYKQWLQNDGLNKLINN